MRHFNEDNIPESFTECRALYREILSVTPMRPREFENAVTHILELKVKGRVGKATPRQWIKAALRVHTKCGKCNGSGQYSTLGTCFACEGHGTQNHDDWVRNRNYWWHRR